MAGVRAKGADDCRADRFEPESRGFQDRHYKTLPGAKQRDQKVDCAHLCMPALGRIKTGDVDCVVQTRRELKRFGGDTSIRLNSVDEDDSAANLVVFKPEFIQDLGRAAITMAKNSEQEMLRAHGRRAERGCFLAPGLEHKLRPRAQATEHVVDRILMGRLVHVEDAGLGEDAFRTFWPIWNVAR